MSHDGERRLFARRLQALPRDVPFALAISEMLSPSRHRWRIGLTVPDMLSSPPVPFWPETGVSIRSGAFEDGHVFVLGVENLLPKDSALM